MSAPQVHININNFTMASLNSRLQLALLNRKKGRNLLEKGFTLVELMIVIVIVGVFLPSLAQLSQSNSQSERKRMYNKNTAAKQVRCKAYGKPMKPSKQFNSTGKALDDEGLNDCRKKFAYSYTQLATQRPNLDSNRASWRQSPDVTADAVIDNSLEPRNVWLHQSRYWPYPAILPANAGV